jgi:hypothetical protein
MELIWKAVILTYFKVQWQDFLGDTEENHGSPQSGQSVYQLGFWQTAFRFFFIYLGNPELH